MGLPRICPKCGESTLEYSNYFNAARCQNLRCEYLERMHGREFLRRFDEADHRLAPGSRNRTPRTT